MPKLLIAIAAAMTIAAVPMTADAAPCKDAKGKFIKCPPSATPTTKPPVKPVPAAAAKPAAKPAGAAPAKPATAGKKGPCRDAKGRFAKCK